MAEEKSEVVLISLSARIPEFWTDQPRLWFSQFEAAVFPQKASDESKYQLLISKLGKQAIQQVSDILDTPPETNKYVSLKQRLMHVYEESENRRIQRLIGDMRLGDQKPSQLLRQMKNLAKSKIADDTVLVLWQNHLPTSVRSVLAATTLTDVDKLADVADKVMETSKPIDISGISVNESSLASALEKLTVEVAELRKDNTSMRRNFNQQGQGSRSRSRSRSRRPFTRPNANDKKRLCYFHHRFGKNAQKCREPCSWVKPQEKSQGN